MNNSTAGRSRCCRDPCELRAGEGNRDPPPRRPIAVPGAGRNPIRNPEELVNLRAVIAIVRLRSDAAPDDIGFERRPA